MSEKAGWLRRGRVVLGAGIAYFAAVFAAGFLFGTLRVLLLEPVVGETGAVLLELPVMLALCWAVSRLLVARLAVPAAWWPRLAMGGVAFLLLMLAEAGLSLFLFGRSPAAHLALYCEPAAIMGQLGQIAFALIPAIQLGLMPSPPGRPNS